MKNILKYVTLIVLIIGALSSCQKLDVAITTQLTPDVFPKDSTQFISASGPVYVALRGYYAQEYFFQQCYSTEEGIMTAHGGNWYDGAQNKEMHYHSWTKDNSYVTGNYG
jgi:hypothetical protein